MRHDGITRIHLIRHGQSLAQTGKALPGDVDPPLSRRGRLQAGRLRSAVDGLAADLVLVSPMRRARDTFRLSGIRAPVTAYDSRLIESDWGDPAMYAPLVDAELPAIASPDRHRAILQPVRRRCASLLGDLRAMRGRTVVLFGHWGIFAHLFHAFFALPPAMRSGMNASDNASLSLLTIDAEGRRSLAYWNERVHLGRLHAQPFW